LTPLFIIHALLILYFAGAVVGYIILVVASLLSSSRYRTRLRAEALSGFTNANFAPPVTIIAPLYNEPPQSLRETIGGLLDLYYPNFEVIAVNDGGPKSNFESLRATLSLVPVELEPAASPASKPIVGVYRSLIEPRFLFVDKENGGKADALNAGLRFAKAPYFCAVDGDTLLEEDALIRALSQMFDARSTLMGAGGIVRVANGCTFKRGRVAGVNLPRRPVELFQILEYLRGFLLGREGWSSFNGLLIVSGAFGIFSRSLAVEIGGYTPGSLGEDMDLVVRIHRHLRKLNRPYRVIFAADPVAWTEVPSDWASLSRQRRRWQRGLLDTLLVSREVIFNLRYGRIGLIGLPYQLIFEFLSPLAEAAGLAVIVLDLIRGRLGLATWLAILLIMCLTSTVLSLIALLVEEITYRRYQSIRDVAVLSGAAVLEFIAYRPFVQLTRLWGMFEGIIGRPRVWGKIFRLGFHSGHAAGAPVPGGATE
jgi:cellulose synthase/poly-beta-1,6-N-acetylglucosamine synthase-like glycosyltransferase